LQFIGLTSVDTGPFKRSTIWKDRGLFHCFTVLHSGFNAG